MQLPCKSSLKVLAHLQPSWGDFSQRDSASFLTDASNRVKSKGPHVLPLQVSFIIIIICIIIYFLM